MCFFLKRIRVIPIWRYTVSSPLLPRCQCISAQFFNSPSLQSELLQLCPSLEGNPKSFLLHFHLIFGELWHGFHSWSTPAVPTDGHYSSYAYCGVGLRRTYCFPQAWLTSQAATCAVRWWSQRWWVLEGLFSRRGLSRWCWGDRCSCKMW